MYAELRKRAFVVLGLSSLAVAQPLLDLFGRNPEFFVAGNYTRWQIVWFAVIIALVPPLIGIAAIGLATSVSQRAGTIVYAVVVSLLGAGLALAVLRSIGVDPVVVAIAVALLGGVGLALLALRTHAGRLLLSYLAIANLAFVGLFLWTSPTSKLVAGGVSEDLGNISVPRPAGPVVVLVLDEFPAATIMRPDGTVNADRFPAFAELAAVSTWFRNASSPHNLTHRAVPSILDGRIGDDGSLPTYEDNPRNLFTLLGDAVSVHGYESVTSLCPPSICTDVAPLPLTQALEDASIVYGHRVLPATLRDSLPPIDNSWGAYGAQEEGGGSDPDDDDFILNAYSRWLGRGADERSPRGQAGVLSERMTDIGADPELHFIHVALPHRPWVLSPNGYVMSWTPTLIRDPADPSYAFENRMEFQLHSMQVGAVDTMVGALLDRLRALPTWEDTLLVVTSDHGTNLTPPDLGRMRITDANREEALRVPLFIKAPGQTTGEVRDDSVQTIDVLPSIVDLLGADVDWKFDGHSLYDGSAATVEPKVSTDVEAVLEIARKRADEFPYGDDWIALAAVGPNGDLVGREVADLRLGTPSEFTVSIDQGSEFAQVPSRDLELPFAISGRVDGPAQPPELLIAVNDRIAGVIGGYRPEGQGWEFIGFLADVYRVGHNDVAVYEVSRSGDAVALHLVEPHDSGPAQRNAQP
jgi:sulfatase-like protein